MLTIILSYQDLHQKKEKKKKKKGGGHRILKKEGTMNRSTGKGIAGTPNRDSEVSALWRQSLLGDMSDIGRIRNCNGLDANS